MSWRYQRFVLGFTLALALAARAHTSLAASEPSPSEVAVARQLFAEADSLRKQGRWRAAIEKLRRAIAIKDTPGLRYHLGYCQVQLGNLVEGLVEYDRSDEMIRAGVAAADVKRLLGVAREELRGRVPQLTLEVPIVMTNAVLRVDQARVSPAVVGRPMPLNPGQHSISVAAPGYKTFARVFALEESQHLVVQVDAQLAPLPAKRPSPLASAPPRPTLDYTSPAPSRGLSTRSYWLLGEAGFTLLSAGVGAVFNFVATSRETAAENDQIAADGFYKRAHPESADKDVSDFSCGAVNPKVKPWQTACANFDQAVFERDRAQTLQVVGFAGAGVGAVAFVATLLFWPKEKPHQQLYLHTLPVLQGVGGEIGWRF